MCIVFRIRTTKEKERVFMDNNVFIEQLMNFGLTRQEASIYQCMLTEGKITGYEVAKQIGISRSNAYNSLASMTEKGAVYPNWGMNAGESDNDTKNTARLPEGI